MTLTEAGRTPARGADPGGAWVAVCALDDLEADRGAAVLVAGAQVALFRLPVVPGQPTGSDEVLAVGNRDPWCDANVLARGIVGSTGAIVYVASPMRRHRFDLRTGRCLDDATVAVAVWATRVVDGRVEVALEEPGA